MYRGNDVLCVQELLQGPSEMLSSTPAATQGEFHHNVSHIRSIKMIDSPQSECVCVCLFVQVIRIYKPSEMSYS